MAKMTPEALVAAVKESDGWEKPEYNEVLYLQCKGFSKITEAMSAYTNCKALWLQQNALAKIENLEAMTDLGVLFVHQNCITQMTGFEMLTKITTLNLSNNYITKVENLGNLPLLETLQISHNRLETLESLAGLAEGKKIATLDISHNGLAVDKEKGEKAEDIIPLFQNMPELKCLYIQGNEITGQTRYWRRKVVGGLKELTYMDERPVFEDERVAVDAWVVGGFEAEQAARDNLRAEKRRKEKENMKKWKEMQEAGRAIKEQREIELAKRNEEQKQWRAELSLAHSRARRECENDFMDARAELWHAESRERTEGIIGTEERERTSAQLRQRQREEMETAEREAKEEIAREDAERAQRREAYAEEMNAQQLSLQQEMEFLERETALLEEREAVREEQQQRELDELVLKGAPAPQPTESRHSHVDPTACAKETPSDVAASYVKRAAQIRQPSAKQTAIWAQFAKWDTRRARKM